jgi:hypothetical protein
VLSSSLSRRSDLPATFAVILMGARTAGDVGQTLAAIFMGARTAGDVIYSFADALDLDGPDAAPQLVC